MTIPSIRSLFFLLAITVMAAAGCSDSQDSGTVTTDPCGGLCPADECFAGTCIGGNNGENNGENNGVNNGDPDAGNNGDPDTPEGCSGDTDCDAEQFCNIPDGADTGSCEDGCRTDDDCGDAMACSDHVCVDACADDDDCADTEYCGPDSGCLTGCRDDDGCDEGFSCVETDTDDGPRQRCAPTVCAERGDCPDGFACVDTSCAPGCTDDSCDDGQTCDPDTLICVTPTGCEADDDCSDTEYCDTDAGECARGCRDNDGCDLGFDCVEHACEPGACDDNDDCAAEYVCTEGACVIGCREDDACGDRQVCEDGECIDGCRVDAPCQVDEYCAIPDGESYGECDRGCRVDGCGDEQFCNLETRICADAGCDNDEACGDGSICVDAVCVAGCRGDEGCNDGQICIDDACMAGCRDDDGCGDDEICSDQACITGCRDDDACGDDEICQDQACIEGCREDDACGDGEICEDAVCGEGCRGDIACDFGDICVELACTSGCRDDEGCVDEQYCDIGDQEVTGQCAVGCRQGECPLGQICDLDGRTCVDEPCLEDAECPLGRVCNNGDCDLGCNNDDERCPLGQACDMGSDRCLDGCRDDLECGDNMICTFDTDDCIPGCRSDDQCGQGFICDETTCVEGCRRDDQCGQLEACNEGQCGPIECVRDEECPEAAYCDRGTCAEGCSGDIVCEEGEICDALDRTCRDGCRVDSACEPTEYCNQDDFLCETGCRFGLCPGITECDVDERVCRNPLCDSDEQCDADRYCNGETCELGCRNDFVCDDGEICNDNSCVTGCRADGDCGDDAYCDQETLTCTVGCRNDPDCDNGEICDANQCRDGCRNDFDCGEGEYCDGSPAGTCTVGCQQFTCPEGEVCDLDSHQCVDAPDPNCNADEDCDLGEVCNFESLVCEPGCRTDDECDDGEVCPGPFVDPARQCRPGCRLDEQCADHQYCDDQVNLICQTGCRDDSSCRPGETCEHFEIDFVPVRECVPEMCNLDADCDADLFCDLETSICTAGCRVDGCPGNDICDVDARVCVEGPCENDIDCNGQGEICIDTECRLGCRDDAECGDGMLCDVDNFRCFEGCREDDTCADGDYCAIAPRDDLGLCEAGCRIDGCPQDQLCDPQNRQCVVSECLVDNDCEDEEYCRDQIECLVGCRGDEACGVDMVCTDLARECVDGCRGGNEDDTCEDVLGDLFDLPLGDLGEINDEFCLEDVDHWAFELGVGEQLQVNGFLPDGGGAGELAILDGCGRVLASDSDPLNPSLDFSAPDDGVYLLRVRGATLDDTNEYSLLLARRHPNCEDDQVGGQVVEPNNTFDLAAALPTVPEEILDVPGLSMCSFDEDWYSVEITEAGQRISVTLSQDVEQVALTVEIFLDDGRILLASNDDVAGMKTAATQALETPGTYLVRISPQEDVPLGAGVGYNLRALITGSTCIADPFERNDSPDTGALLPQGSSPASMCGADNDTDWYRMLLQPGDFVSISYTYDHDSIGDLPELPATLYGPGGPNDVRDFFARVGDTDTDAPFQAPGGFTVGEGDGGFWLFSVEAGGVNLEVPYVVEFNVEAPVCDDDDEQVPNNRCADATPLDADEDLNGYICGPQGDEDWFGITVDTIGADIRVEVEHFHFEGNLDLEVYEPGGETLVGFSYGVGPEIESVEFEATTTGTYCARVFGRGQVQNGYVVRYQD